MTTIKIGTYNLFDFGKTQDAADLERYAGVRDVVVELDVDVLMVQEICGRAHENLARLAAETGLECHYQQPWWNEEDADAGKVAIAPAGGDPRATYHVGLLWRDSRVTPDPLGFRSYGGEFWHGLATLELDVGATRIRVGSYHGPPFGRGRRADEAERVASAFTRPSTAPPGIVGGDWNSISADRIPSPEGEWGYHFPDPYAALSWCEPLIHQCEWDIDPTTGLSTGWRADRRPGEILWAAGLRDTAALAGTTGGWQRTTGHDETSGLGDRAIDTLRVTPRLADAVLTHDVIDTELTRSASDHLPVISTIDLSRISDEIPTAPANVRSDHGGATTCG